MLNEKISNFLSNDPTLENLKAVVNEYNESLLNNAPLTLDFAKVETFKNAINSIYEKDFIDTFVNLAKQDKAKAINSLLTTFNFKQISVKIEENNTYSIIELDGKGNNLVKLFDFKKLEKAYQLANSTETDKDGKPLPNKTVTIFGALRIYGLTQTFINFLIKENLDTKDLEKYKVKLEKIVVGDEKIFDENDNKAFESISNNNLEKQLNILVRLMGFNGVKLLKRDVKVLKMLVLKIKQDKHTAHHKIKDIDTLTFLNHIFSRIKEYLDNNNGKKAESKK